MPEERPYRRWLRLPLGGARRAEEEMDEEIDSHLQLCAEALVRQGHSPETAMRLAMERFGDLAGARNQLRAGAREREQNRQQRDRRGAIFADLKYAIGQMRRAPGFSVLAVVTLALGIGLTTATFTLVNGVLLRPLALQQPERLVSLASRDSTGREFEVVSAGNWSDWRASSRALEEAAIHMSRPMTVGTDDGAVRVPGQIGSGNFFEVLRPPMLLGRGFTEAEVDEQTAVAVISEGLWRQLGSDSSLAKALRIDGVEHAVIGVVRSGSDYPAGTMVWGGVTPPPEFGAMRNNVNWSAVGRLKPGVSLEQAREDLDRVAREIRSRIPEALYSYGVGVTPLQQYVVGDADRMLKLLMLAVAAVLLVACANLAAANLGRSASRSREFAVRVALGAGRGRLVQQVLIEQGVLALLGGAIGSWLGWLAVRSVLHTWAGEIPRATEVTFDPAVLLFAIGVSVIAGLIAGLSPALRSSQVSPYAVMSGGTRTASGGRGLPGAWLIGGEIALALMLLTCAGLLLRSFDRLLTRGLGFSTSVVTAEASLSRLDFATPEVAAQFWATAMTELRAMPGVQSVGAGTWVPLGSGGATFIEVAGREGSGQGAQYRIIGGDYFPALSVPLRSGRLLDERDSRAAPRAVVINQRMAEEYWPGVDPIGRQVRATSMEQGPGGVAAPWLTIVGVVANVRHFGMETDLEPEMYVDYRQVPWWAYGMTALVRASGSPVELTRAVRTRLQQLNPNVGFVMGTLQERLDRSLANRRFAMGVLTGFSVLALVLAAIGLYAVLAYSVARRTRELAVRSALGATRVQLVRLVFGGAARVVLAGMAIGLVGALLLGRSMTAFLIDISAFDAVSFGLAAAVLIGVSALAVIVPSLRATRTDPNVALQQE
jgi:predicted permease